MSSFLFLLSEAKPMPKRNRGEHLIPVAKIRDGGDNVRFEMGEVEELAASIKRMGILQPLIVSPEGDGFLLVAGHRRLAAAKMAGLASVPVVERDLSADDRVDVMVTENVLRKNLTHIEEAKAYKRLMERDGLTQRELATHLGISPTTVNKKLRFLDLPPHVQREVIEGRKGLTAAVDENPTYNVSERRRERWADRVRRLREMPNRVYVVVVQSAGKAPPEVQVFVDPDRAFALRDQLARTSVVHVHPCDIETPSEVQENQKESPPPMTPSKTRVERA